MRSVPPAHAWPWPARRKAAPAAESDYVPAAVTVIDLDQSPPDLSDVDAERIFTFVRRGVQPLGTIELDTVPSGAELLSLARSRFGSNPAPAPSPAIADRHRSATVVVATRDRPDFLERCLRSLDRMTVQPDRIVVVDSAPRDPADAVVRSVARQLKADVDYFRTTTPGLAEAHNVALASVGTEIVAFTDDDVLVDPHWLEQILVGFDLQPGIGAVTGLILPAELETWPQAWTETSVGLQKGYEARLFDLGPNRPDDPLFPFAAGCMGSGANMAFDTKALRAIGGFDRALGAGTPARGGDDLHAFYTTVASGRSLLYQPSAIVFHHHRRDYGALRDMAKGYGVGASAYLTSVMIADPAASLRLLRVAVQAVLKARSATAGSPGSAPEAQRDLVWIQRLGLLAGPVRYLQSRRRMRRLAG